MIKHFYFYNREYTITDSGIITRLAFNDIRIQKYNGKCIKLNRHNKEKELKPYIDADGYANVTLYSKPHKKTFLVHHLIYMIYKLNLNYIEDNDIIGYKNNFNQINHIDSNKLNNYPDNLELVSLQDNISHSVRSMTHNSQLKALYIEIYKDGIYLDIVWKFKGVSEYLYKYFHKYINTGTLCSYCKQGKDYYGFTFKYKV